jgi:hypothetical protein
LTPLERTFVTKRFHVHLHVADLDQSIGVRQGRGRCHRCGATAPMARPVAVPVNAATGC